MAGASDLWYRAALSGAAAMVILSPDGTVLDANPAFSDLVGEAEEELVGKPIAFLQTPYGIPLTVALSSGLQGERGEAALCIAGAPVRWMSYSASRFEHEGRPMQALTLVDTTEQRRLLDTLHEGVVVQDGRGRVLALNRRAEQMLGLTLAEMRLRKAQDFEANTLRPDGTPCPAADQPAKVALRTGRPVLGQVLGIRRPDNEILWVRVNCRAYAENDGDTAFDATRVVSTFVDITDLVDADSRFRAIFDHTFEFIGLLDRNGIMLEANKTALDFINVSLAEVAGKPFADTPWWSQSAERELLLQAIEKAGRGVFVRFETTHPSPDGQILNIDFSLRPIFGPDGQVKLIIPEGRDITDAKRSEAELRAAKAEAETASRAKSAFLATMSHELRTPLNAVIGYTELIRSEVFGPVGNDRYAEYLGLVHGSAEHLLEVINDILDISKIETGKIALRESSVDLALLIQRVVRLVGHKAEEHQVGLTLSLPEPCPVLFADQQRCSQILLNLISNAVKFTPQGGRVEVAVEMEGDGCAIRISDTGIGIPADLIPLVWRPFEQVDSTLARRYEGVGLGLPITKHLIEAHGGTIDLISEVGRGTTVTVRWPAERVRQPNQAAETGT